MVFSIRVSTVLVLAASVSSVLGAPWPSTSKHSTHRYRTLSNGVVAKSYQPESVYETFGAGIDHPLSKRDVPASTEDAALSFLASHLGVNASSLNYHSGFDGELAGHAYVRQTFVSTLTRCLTLVTIIENWIMFLARH